MKFSLASLLFLVLIAALGCAALVNANDTWRQSMVTLVLSVLLIATLATAVNRSRAFALGFTVAGWIYLLLVFVPALGLRDDLLTDEGVRWLYAAIHDEEATEHNYIRSIMGFSPDGSRIVTGRRNNTVIWNVATGAEADTVNFHNFADIGHGLWGLLVACLGGAVAGFLARKNTDESVSTATINQARA